MPKRFNKKNSQKYVVVHRPHDDPQYYDNDAPEHVLVSASNPNSTKATERLPSLVEDPARTTGKKENEHVGEAVLYGIDFDDSKYDYTKHLKPIGTDPENSLFIPAKKQVDRTKSKKSIDDLFVEPQYQNANSNKNEPVFTRGVARQEYLERQQNVADELTGFRPDMNPALREALEALEDEAYVVNKDRELKKAQEDANEDDDDVFQQLLEGGQAADEDEFEENLDEWDIDNLDAYEDEHYQKEMEELDNVENLEDLKNIDYQADVQRFKKEQKRDILDDQVSSAGPQSVEPEEELDQEENDGLGELPSIKQTKGKKRKDRQKMGTKSDLTGFSMSSSAIARTETMTILDDKYDNVISGYENYQDEQEELEEKHSKPFDMSQERSDFESMLDDFLDNYELGKGGRELHKKDEEVQNMKRAADEVSKGKLSQRRNRERTAKSTKGITSSLSGLHI
ncbi:protein ltv1 [Zygosaccharomyces mellis]|uniref:Protein ltv1 n=1 Tax=Zygosaccharomyces mellis TaxID=42258 RepID=A0A4C2E3H9_9SACH|nr:protein ltv1 [Zygosaccharomyces mellis]